MYQNKYKGGYIAAKGLILRDIALKVLFKCNLEVDYTLLNQMQILETNFSTFVCIFMYFMVFFLCI